MPGVQEEAMNTLIPVPMCHGLGPNLSPKIFGQCLEIAKELGFESIDYDQLIAWLQDRGEIPARPIMFTFDHAFRNILLCQDMMKKHGYSATLFVDTGRVQQEIARGLPDDRRVVMNWTELKYLAQNGWQIGGHTHSHIQACKALQQDPSGKTLREDMRQNNDLLLRNVGVEVKDLAYAGPSWTPQAEAIAKDLYRTARLWIRRATYQVEGREVPYAQFMGSSEPDADDGGPSWALRYITPTSDPHRLPSLEWTIFLNTPEAFRSYLEYACRAQNRTLKPMAS